MNSQAAAQNGALSPQDPQTLAEACAAFMWSGDRVAQSFGARLESAGPGRAVVSLTVTDAMLNGFDTCHGGVSFSLADTAFSLACNSRNERAVAQFCTIHFLQAGRPGQTLIAESVECALVGRSGVYDTEVRTGDGEVIAQFRGHSRLLGGTVLPE
jgi:acyl-CoA thioesterase